MKKILLLFFLVLFLSGCSAEVNIIIDEKNVSETTKIFALKNEVYSNGAINESIDSNLEDFEREIINRISCDGSFYDSTSGECFCIGAGR